VLRKITLFAGDIPAQTWRNLSAHLHYEETQFYATKASEASVLDGVNLPACAMTNAGILQKLLTSRTVPEIHNVIPPWRASNRRVRDPQNDRGRGRGRGNEDDTDGNEDGDRDHTSSYDTNVPDVVKALMTPYWKAKTGIQVAHLCTLAGVDFADLPQAFNEKCLNKFLGKCNNYKCRRNHDFSSISEDDAQSLCHILEPGVNKAVAEGGHRWW